jgi:hypothetical protein
LRPTRPAGRSQHLADLPCDGPTQDGDEEPF